MNSTRDFCRRLRDTERNVRGLGQIARMSESNLLELPFTAPPPPEPGRIVVSDAFELLRSLAPESVDLVVTDPPYESLQVQRGRGTTTRLTTNWFATVPNERLPELLRATYR